MVIHCVGIPDRIGQAATGGAVRGLHARPRHTVRAAVRAFLRATMKPGARHGEAEGEERGGGANRLYPGASREGGCHPNA
jgi:hypothetical protein